MLSIKNGKRKTTVRAKISRSLLSVIVLFGIFAVILTFTSTFSYLKNEKKLNILDNTVARAGRVNETFLNSKYLVETLAKSPDTVEFLASTVHTDATRLKETNYLSNLNINKMYSAIYLIDKTGKTLVSTDSSFVGKDYSFRDYFIESMLGRSYVDLAIGVTSKQLGYYFSAPVVHNNEILGVAVVKQIPDFINNNINLEDDKSSVMFADRFGVIVASSKEDILYSSLGTFSSPKKEEITQKNRFANYVIKPLTYDVLQNEVFSYLKPIVFEIYDVRDKENEVIAISRVGNFPFYLITEANIDDVETVALVTAVKIAGYMTAMIVILTLFVSYLISNILKPLSDIQSLTKSVSSGILNKTVVVRSNDEIEDLANSFNQMTQVLRDERDNTEKKIQDRTENLSNLNNLMIGRELKMIELKKYITKLENDLKNAK